MGQNHNLNKEKEQHWCQTQQRDCICCPILPLPKNTFIKFSPGVSNSDTGTLQLGSICGRPCALRLEARMSFCLGVSFEGAFCTVLWFALQFSSTLNKCEEASLTFNKRGFSFFPNQLSPFSHSSQSSDAIPQSGPWQWAAYRAGHKQNINGVWAGLSYATPHLSFPKCELLEGNWPSP